MSSFYHLAIFNPLYNILIALFGIPLVDAGVAVIILTVIVRLILYPLSKKAVTTQVRMQEIAPELAKIKEKYPDSQEQAQKTLELYKQKSVNPFSGVFVLLIQLPIIFALYRIFLQTGFPQVDTPLLYSFVHIPTHISTMFLGLFDITHKSIVLALLAAVSAYFQISLATSRQPAPTKTSKSGFGDDLARSMQTQMKYFFPIIVFFIAYKISGVVALYWLTTNLFTIGQEIVVRKNLSKENILVS